jgi:hypothetical protein
MKVKTGVNSWKSNYFYLDADPLYECRHNADNLTLKNNQSIFVIWSITK